MSGDKNYKAAIIGVGRIGFSLGLDKKREQPASHSMAMNENSRIDLIAGCDLDPVAINAWHDFNKKALVYKDSANLYARQKLDLVTVAVNEDAHMKEALDAIISKPRLVILEKPVALSVDDALCILDWSKRNEVPVMINHERRFAEDYRLAKSYISKIGELQKIRASLSSGMVVYSPSQEATGAYSLFHDGTHLVDTVLYFLENGDVPSPLINSSVVASNDDSSVNKGGLLKHVITAGPSKSSGCMVNSILHNPIVTSVYRDEKGDVRQLCAHYTTEKCPDVEIYISGRSKYFAYDIEIIGTIGKIVIGNGYMKLYKTEKSHFYSGFFSLSTDASVRLPRKTLYFENLYKNAVAYLDGTETLKSTIEHGINSLAVLEEIKRKL